VDNSSDPHISPLVREGFLVRTLADEDYSRGNEAESLTNIQHDYFDVIDAKGNNDNRISQFEIKDFLNALGAEYSPSGIVILFGLCTGSSNNSLDFSSFQCVLENAEEHAPVLIATLNPSYQSAVSSRDLALSSGAHFISSDWFLPPFDGADISSQYWVEFPSKYPYRCNPITTVGVTCSDDMFESTSFANSAPPTPSPAPTSSSTSSITTSTTATSTTTTSITENPSPSTSTSSSLPDELNDSSSSSLNSSIFFCGIISFVIVILL